MEKTKRPRRENEWLYWFPGRFRRNSAYLDDLLDRDCSRKSSVDQKRLAVRAFQLGSIYSRLAYLPLVDASARGRWLAVDV